MAKPRKQEITVEQATALVHETAAQVPDAPDSSGMLAGIDMASLTMQMRTFIREYLTGDHPYNGTKAAIAAGYSPRTAASSASRILARPDVKQVIRQFNERAEAMAINKLRDWKELAPEAQRVVAGIAEGTVTALEPFELQVRLNAAKEIMDRAYGKIKNTTEVTGKDGAALIPMDAVRRAVEQAEKHNGADDDESK